MKARGERAFSMVELLTVVAIIGLLAGMLLTALASAKAKSRQTACLNQLRQIGIGFAGYALNQEGKYPMDVAARLGGSLEFRDSLLITNTAFSRDFHHFFALSNEVPDVKVMTCPADRRRRAAKSYAVFTNENLSYWVNTRATPYATGSPLCGDWNVSPGAAAETNVVNALDFGNEVHRKKGCVLFADGRVEITRSVASVRPAAAEPAVASNNLRDSSLPKPGLQTPTPTTYQNGAGATPPSVDPTRGAVEKAQTNSPATAQSQSTNVNRPVVGASSRRISTKTLGRIGSSSDDGSASRQESVSAPSRVTKPPSEGGSDEWDTPGFRLFKLLAIASYLISLIWAIIALLLLYLRSRIAQRREAEKQNSAPME